MKNTVFAKKKKQSQTHFDLIPLWYSIFIAIFILLLQTHLFLNI